MTSVKITIALCWMTVVVTGNLDFGYHDQAAINSYMTDVVNDHPDLARKYSIGKSVRNHDLLVLALGRNPNNHVTLRPHLKYIANMHGNEVVGREVLLHFIDYLVQGYSTNTTIQELLNNTLVHIMPTMNPDGFEDAFEGNCTGVIGRANANGYDLNRNFPDKFDQVEEPGQPEMKAIQQWLQTQQFVLSANLHGGAYVVNYPYDNYVNGSHIQEIRYSRCPDDDTFQHISRVFSFSHHMINKGNLCGDLFPDGITNGAMWYPVAGGMQDYNYVQHGVMEVTVEQGCCKFPMRAELPQYWEENKDALFNYLKLGYTLGVKGLVLDINNNPVHGAVLSIKGRESVPFTSTSQGEYWRLLMPGTYDIMATHNGTSISKQFTVMAGKVTRVDIIMDPTENTAAVNLLRLWLLVSTTIMSLCLAFY